MSTETRFDYVAEVVKDFKAYQERSEAERQSLADRLVKALKTIEERDKQIEMWKRRGDELGDLVRQRNQVIDDLKTYARQRDDAEARTVIKAAVGMTSRDNEIAKLKKQLAERKLPVEGLHFECNGCGGLFLAHQLEEREGGRCCTGCLANEELVGDSRQRYEEIRKQAKLIKALEERNAKIHDDLTLALRCNVDLASRLDVQAKPTGKQPREIWLAFDKADGMLARYASTNEQLCEEFYCRDLSRFDFVYFREVV